MTRFIVLLLVSFSFAIAPFKQAFAFVPAAALVGYVVTTGGTAYRIGQAGAAIGAIAMLLLSSDSSNTTRGRLSLKTGVDPVPRQITTTATSSTITVSSPPPEYANGCLWSYQGINSAGSPFQTQYGSTCQSCANAWSSLKNAVDSLNSITNKKGQVISCSPHPEGISRVHRYKWDTDTTVNYSVDSSQGFGYVPAPRTTPDTFADAKIVEDTQTGKIIFSPLPDDPDFQTQVDGGSSHPILDPDTGALTMYGVTPEGNQRSISSVINSDGSVDIIETTNNSDGTSVSIGRTTINPTTGSITGAATSVQTGRVTTPTTTTVETFPALNPGAGTGTGTTTGTIQFPTDYARQYEAQQAAQTITAAIQAQTNILMQSTGEPLAPPIADFEFFGDIFDELLAWQLPAHNGECPVSTFDWEGTHTFDVHCDLIEDFRTQIDISFVLLWSLLGLAIVLRA